MISKEEFLSMSNNDAIYYVVNHYCMDDVNEVCEDAILEEDYEEDEDCYEDDYEDGSEEYEVVCEDELQEDIEEDENYGSPFAILVSQMDSDELKDFLWDNIIERCEELDENATEVAEDEKEEF